MKRVRVGELQEGMVVADDVYDEKLSTSIPVLRKGVVLTKEYINSLRSRNCWWVFVETPERYRGAAGEVLELRSITNDILFEGRVSVFCDIPENIKIEAGESIVVRGKVRGGCFLSTRKGAVSIQGAIQGSTQEPVKIVSFQNVTIAKEVRGADMKTSGEVVITGDIIDSSIVAQGDITGERSVVRSQLFSQSRIRLGECGDGQKGQCLLVVKPRECREISQELLKIDAKMLELQNEMNSLRSMVDTVKKLGRGIDQLSEEKKREFAMGIKHFKEVEESLSSLQEKRGKVRNEIERHVAVKRIMVTGDVYPPTKVIIENYMQVTSKKEQGLAFYVREGRIAASPFTGAFSV